MTDRVTLPEYVATPVKDIDGVGVDADMEGRIVVAEMLTRQIVQRISSRFTSGVTLSLDYRRYNLKQLGYLLKDNEGLILEAARRDLGRGDVDAIISDVSHLRSTMTVRLSGRSARSIMRLTLR